MSSAKMSRTSSKTYVSTSYSGGGGRREEEGEGEVNRGMVTGMCHTHSIYTALWPHQQAAVLSMPTGTVHTLWHLLYYSITTHGIDLPFTVLTYHSQHC